MRLATLAGADMSSAPPDGTIRVLIADDDPLLRAGLRMMLTSAADVDVVAEAGDGAQVLPLAGRYAPDMVLMDIRMPVMGVLAATEALRSRRGAPEVVILTTFDADEHVLRALRAGAAGFVLKDTPPHDILAALRRVARGEPVLSPRGDAAPQRGPVPERADSQEARLAHPHPRWTSTTGCRSRCSCATRTWTTHQTPKRSGNRRDPCGPGVRAFGKRA